MISTFSSPFSAYFRHRTRSFSFFKSNFLNQQQHFLSPVTNCLGFALGNSHPSDDLLHSINTVFMIFTVKILRQAPSIEKSLLGEEYLFI